MPFYDPLGDLTPELQKAARAAVRYACQHFCPSAYTPDYWRDECLQIAGVAVWYASRHYKPDYGVSLTTYAYICALRALKKEYGHITHLYQHEAPWPTNPETGEELEVVDVNAQETIEWAVWRGELLTALAKLSPQAFCQRGRYLQVQVVFSRRRQGQQCSREVCRGAFGDSPILYDLTIASLCECPRGALQGTLYCDRNRNGSQDASENGLAGWTVVLRDTHGNTASVTTDAQGHYEVETLPSGRYEVAVVIPPAWRAVTPATGRYEVEVQEGRAYRLDFGVALRADVNADGFVGDDDLLSVLLAFGSAGQELPEDVNGDGIVDDADVLIVLLAFGSGC